MQHIICFSGGDSSGTVALNVADRFGVEDMTLLNHDINPSKEDLDIKRFKTEIANHLGLPITYANIQGITDPEKLPDQFDVCVEADAIVNPHTFEALCTSRLKTEPFYNFIATNYPSAQSSPLFPGEEVTIYYGFDKKEIARVDRRTQILGMMGYKTDYPLAYWKDLKYSSSQQVGIMPPLTYKIWLHANCIGCLKSGLLHWYVTFVHRPDVYEKGIWMEDETGYAIHSITRGGIKSAITLRELAVYFENMKASGVPATEHQKPLKFARSLDKYGIKDETPERPCNCVI